MHISLMSLRSPSHFKASMVLTITDYLFIHNYIRSLLNFILKPISIIQAGLESMTVCHVLLLACLTPYNI